ncbi:hypothetical protein [Streptomyces reniochalinae]|uniref:Amidase n=1 Tax=Streptomyces reniochalinae TaxID=2250578 RepID=A0A367EF22_9ACTN|nr:hypothetical protein [Streptomyces reniochalinae]RCG15820.1 hypothetical protein DQ392_22380 [Streptomyces reniochalinae]
MPTDALTPQEAARWADRSGLPLDADRHAEVAATAQYIHSVVSVLHEIDFADTPPAPTYRVPEDVRGGQRHCARA